MSLYKNDFILQISWFTARFSRCSLVSKKVSFQNKHFTYIVLYIEVTLKAMVNERVTFAQVVVRVSELSLV